MSFLMIVELLVVLVALWVGARYGSLALGAISGIGLAILVFCFNLKPGEPPTDVIYIIIAAVTCAGMLQASGGMDWMIQIAERLLRKHPDRITFLAPFTTFFLTVLVGTGHVVYTLMPIICDIALKKGIRPERPCSVASIAAQIGITCSPIAAGVVSNYPWAIAIAFFLVSVLINSQGAVVVAMLPLAYSLHIEGWVLLGVLPSVYGYFFIPNYPSDIATVNFDRSGTTVIGKYLLNHSFMMPGMIHVITATICGYGISALFHFVFHLY